MNVPAALAAYPGAAGLVKQLVLMSGLFLTDELGIGVQLLLRPGRHLDRLLRPCLDLMAAGNDVTEKCGFSVPQEVDRLARLGGPHAVVRGVPAAGRARAVPRPEGRRDRLRARDLHLLDGRVDVELTRTHAGPMTVWDAGARGRPPPRDYDRISVERFWSQFASMTRPDQGPAMDIDEHVLSTTAPITRSRVRDDLARLGVVRGDALMIHARLSAVGYLPGGPDSLILGLLDAVGETGTLMATCGWEYGLPYELADWPSTWRDPILAECPSFDPRTAPCDVSFGRFPEALRRWPGALRSDQPDASFVALGHDAHRLIDDAPRDDPHGPDSPLARLVALGGHVLVLGAPLDTITLLHHAEALSDGAGKRFVEYEQPVLEDGRRVWRRFCDIDSENGAYPYELVLPEGHEAFSAIAQEVVAAGHGRRGTVAAAESHLLPAAEIVRHGVRWIEERFPRSR